MNCIYCGAETDVINSRPQKRINQVWRRRKCRKCSAVFTTAEAAVYEAAWRVRSASGALAPFNRHKLFISLHKSLEHRPEGLSDAVALTDTIIDKLRPAAQNGAVEAKNIADTTLSVLRRFDNPAAIHYQAFHQSKKAASQLKIKKT